MTNQDKAAATESLKKQFAAKPGYAFTLATSYTASSREKCQKMAELMEAHGFCTWHAHAVVNSVACQAACCKEKREYAQRLTEEAMSRSVASRVGATSGEFANAMAGR